jgi:hypothetical protein
MSHPLSSRPGASPYAGVDLVGERPADRVVADEVVEVVASDNAAAR